MKYCLVSLLCLSFSINLFAQSSGEVEMETKEVSDTILGNRSLLYAGTFNAERALIQLFPGKFYHKNKELVINWTCEKCKPIPYYDVNGDIAEGKFPFSSGVATRLINEMDFKDAGGTAYKVISFNHSDFDPDGAQMVRFQGGVLGLAKFVLTDNGWKLRMFTPAIGGFGSFSQSPAPKPFQIGDGQYAFTLRHSNGGAGGAYYAHLYLVAGINGVYKTIMEAPFVDKTNDPESAWTYEVTTTGDKKQFKDILIKISGTYTEDDKEYLPDELLNLTKGKKNGSFTAEERYVYNGRNYVLQKPVMVTAK